jgi:hypothetical protein
MNLLDVYNALEKMEITVEQAADVLGLTPRDMRFRLTKWGDKLPTLLSTLDKISAGTVSRGRASELIGVGPRQVNHLMGTWKVHRPLPNYVVDATVSAIKWEIRKKYAIEYISGAATIEDSSEDADLSTRQMRRWVSGLIKKHFGMVFKDLKGLPGAKRRRLAHEIENAEGLEYAKQSVIEAIRRGEATLQEEAAARLAGRHVRKGGGGVRSVQKTGSRK